MKDQSRFYETVPKLRYMMAIEFYHGTNSSHVNTSTSFKNSELNAATMYMQMEVFFVLDRKS